MALNKKSQLRVIAGKWRGRKIQFIDQDGLRPTPDRVRETVFNWLQADITNACCLDLFAGSGTLGFEAVSRGALQVVMVDSSKPAIQMIQENIAVLQSSAITPHAADAVSFLKASKMVFDVVFLDPPYQLNILPAITTLLEQEQCLAEHAKIYLEHDVKQAMPTLPENWRILKNKTAGRVSYYLLERF